jgi:Zn-dependent protease with chaperone function
MMKTTGFGPIAATLALREQSHRRLTLLAIASLLLLSTSPVVGHHLPLAADEFLAGVDHIGRLCVTALHLLLAPVHRLFHVLIAAGVVYAVWDRACAWRATRRALRPLEARAPTPDGFFWRVATDAGLDPRRVRIVEGLPNPAFTVGIVRPRVYVAEELADVLDVRGAVAVLAHERAHVDRRDPLRLSVLRALACMLFWIPALRRLADDMADEAEVLADDAAASGRPVVLASAILSLAQWPAARRRSADVIGFNEPDLLDRRIRRLLGQEPPVRTRVTRRSLVGAAGALMLVWASSVSVVHPLPATSSVPHERHCDHRGQLPIVHLFCLGLSLSSAPQECPHRHEA